MSLSCLFSGDPVPSGVVVGRRGGGGGGGWDVGLGKSEP